ncbi:hypothetical protein Golob_003293, partial [Gossypium lobatum]|nr:hypothetical protein [Gossypium lobatum]
RVGAPANLLRYSTKNESFELVQQCNGAYREEMYTSSMRKSFKDSLKVLEADIQHANTLASDFPREYDGACLQMRMSYSPAAHLFLFLVQWTDFHLAGALGLLRILIYK